MGSQTRSKALITILLVNYFSGVVPSNLNPPPLHHGQWLPRIDSETSNYYQDRGEPHQPSYASEQSSVKYISTYPQRPNPATNYRQVQAQHYQYNQQRNPSFQDNPAERKIIAPIPEPKPRHDELQEKLGFSMFSSLFPTSVLNLGSLQQQPEGSDSENVIESDNNNDNSPYLDDSELLQDPPQQSDNHPALVPMSSVGDENEGGTSQEMDPDPEPFDSDNEENSGEGGGNIFSRIRNILPFGNGLLAGLRSNSSADDNMEVPDSNEQSSFPNSGIFSSNNEDSGDQNAPSFNLFGGNPLPSPFAFGSDNGGSSIPSPLSFDSNQFNLQNGNNEGSQESGDDNNDDNGDGSSFNFLPSLPSLPNPFQGLRNALSNLGPASSEGGYESNGPVDITQQISLVDPLSPMDPEDSTATPLQSIADGGLSGVLGPLLAIIAKLAVKYKATTAALPWLKVGAVIYGPVFAGALAAMIIGIVYVSIYVPAWAIRLGDLDGEMYILPFKQVLQILGIPDPLEALFDGRSMPDKNMTFGLNDLRKKAFLAGTPHEAEHCMERFACEIIGRKWLQKPSWKDGYIARGVRSVLDDGSRGKTRIRIESSWPSVRAMKAFLEAVATGLTSPESIDVNPKTSNSTSSPCIKYACDPAKLVRMLMARSKNMHTNLKNESQINLATKSSNTPAPAHNSTIEA